MIRDIARLVALWRPPQRVENGKLMPEQMEITKMEITRDAEGFWITSRVNDPGLEDHVHVILQVTHDTIAEKKAALGHHIVEELTKAFETAVAAHPRAHEAIPYHHHMKPR